MAQFKFRQLERLEARENPAGDWAAGIANASANEGLLRAVSDYIIGTGQENSFSVRLPEAIIHSFENQTAFFAPLSASPRAPPALPV